MTSHHLGVRLSDEELGKLREDAAALGLTPSAYVRFMLSLPIVVIEPDEPDPLGELRGISTENRKLIVRIPVVDRATSMVVKRELAAQGSNINQAASSLNLLAKLARSSDDTRMDWRVFPRDAERRLSEARDALVKLSDYCNKVAREGGVVDAQGRRKGGDVR